MATKTDVFLYLMLILANGASYEIGAPQGTCLTMFPKHGHEARFSESPFVIVTSKGEYQPSEVIELTLKANDGRLFRGIQIRGHRLAGDTEQTVGQFIEYPTNKTKVYSCYTKNANVLTHANNMPVREIKLKWQAPDVDIGNITFTATFVEDHDNYWINVKSHLRSNIPVPQTLKNRLMNHPINIDFNQCGTQMGCFLYPRICTGTDCCLGMTYVANSDGVTFTLFGHRTRYLSLGFSHDRKMGEDQTISCTFNGADFNIQHGYNPVLYNEHQLLLDRLSNMSATYRDGNLYCTFTRPWSMDSDHFGRNVWFNLTQPYYVMLAIGHVYDGTDVMGKHVELPVVSQYMVDFDVYAVHRGEALPRLTQAHGILALIAWILFAGVMTVIARHYRPMVGDSKVCGTKYWFQLHRLFAVMVFLLTAAAFIIIFVHLMGLTEHAVVHGWIGVGVMALLVLQVAMGMLRPQPDNSWRTLFNWGHWFLGKSLHMLAAAVCLLAFYVPLLPHYQSIFGIAVVIAWIVVQAIWELLFEINKCRNDRSKAKAYAVEMKAKESPTWTLVDKIMLACYIVCLLALIVAACLSIFLF